MGILTLGTALDWPKTQEISSHVRECGIVQLLELWREHRAREDIEPLWGDEIEYQVVAYDDTRRQARLSLRVGEILNSLAIQKASSEREDAGPRPLPFFHPEASTFNLESTPGKPWGLGIQDLLDVEANMTWRRAVAKRHMYPNEYLIGLPTFPRLGAKPTDTTIVPCYSVHGEKLRSQFVPDETVGPHVRHLTSAHNIRSRRGRKVEINVPIFRDDNTPWPFHDPTINYKLDRWPEDKDVHNGAAKTNHIYMDALPFGAGSCALQVTVQLKNINEARKLYDQLLPLGPILLALTAAAPIYKGFLAGTDARWNQLCAALDDRTVEELRGKAVENSRWRIPKSRFACNSTYIAQDLRLRPEYQDPDLVIDGGLKKKLVDGGMDDLLATHFAHLFIRDPMVVFTDDWERLMPQGVQESRITHPSPTGIKLSPSPFFPAWPTILEANYFEHIQSTNWQHIRFKPPPTTTDKTGWRVEFRPMEVQITDFENAAFSLFVVLLARAALEYDLNFYIPVARVTQNMDTAHALDAVLKEEFWFRKDILGPCGEGTREAVSDEYERMTVDVIINGRPSSPQHGSFPGLMPLVRRYIDAHYADSDARSRRQLDRYMELVARRASGTLCTAARWTRDFVRAHPAYRRDSVVGEEVCYDLMQAVRNITEERGRGRDGLGGEMLGGLASGE